MKLNINKKLLLLIMIGTFSFSNLRNVVAYSNITYSVEDQSAVITYFDEMKISLEDKLKNKSENINEVIEDNFIIIIDFIFYDTSINGITFKELNEDNKKHILDLFNKMDEDIMSYFPNYKEEFKHLGSDIVITLTDLIKKGSKDIKNLASENLSSETLTSLNTFKENTKDFIEDTSDIINDIASFGKIKIKNAYENLRK